MKSKMTDIRSRVVALAMLLVAGGVWNTSEVQAQEPAAERAPAEEQAHDAAGDLRYSLSYVGRFTPATNDAFAMGLGAAPGLRVGVEGLFLDELGLGFVVHGGTRQATPFDRTMELRWDRVGFMAEADYGMRFLDERLRPALRVGLGYMHH